MKTRALFWLIPLLAFPLSGVGCTGAKPTPSAPSTIGTPVANALPPTDTTPSDVQFVDVAESAGLHYTWEIAGKRPLNILQTIGNGCAFLDYDNDGNLDILLVGPKLALYKGDGKGHFTDVSREAGLADLTGNFLGCTVGDYDNDGFDDIYITAYRGGVLLHNEGGKRFKEVSASSGIGSIPWGTSATFTDVDGDGKLDLYVCNYVQFGPETEPQLCDYSGHLGACGPRFYKPEFGRLFRNLGSGKFANVTQTWKLNGSLTTGQSNLSGKGLGVAAADYDGSGRQSLYIANDEMPGDLLQNLKGAFKNVGATTGTSYDSDGNVHGGMGADWGDYDNDGKLDLVVATFQHETKNIYHNDGGPFTDSAAALGLSERTKPYVSFGVKWADFDNDGYLDLVFANGHVQDNIADVDKSATFKQATMLFRNRKGSAFEDLSARAGAALQKSIMGRGLAVGDYDNDGRVDILIVDSEGKPLLLHNETAKAGHWLSCRLEGTHSNRDGIGALVIVQAAGMKQTRRCATDGSYMSASDRRVHIGLGSAEKIDSLTVQWPGGKTETYQDVPLDREVILREGDPHPRLGHSSASGRA